jgi:hypothetical protein
VSQQCRTKLAANIESQDSGGTVTIAPFSVTRIVWGQSKEINPKRTNPKSETEKRKTSFEFNPFLHLGFVSDFEFRICPF